MKPSKKIQLCNGCRDDFYNDHNPYGVKKCWSFKGATVEKRLIIPVDLKPPYKFPPKWVLSCYHPERTVNVKPAAINKDGFWRV
jgi:hypothetical protein